MLSPTSFLMVMDEMLNEMSANHCLFQKETPAQELSLYLLLSGVWLHIGRLLNSLSTLDYFREEFIKLWMVCIFISAWS